MATIYKNNKSWYIRFQLDGKHRQRSLGAISEADARKVLEAVDRGHHKRRRKKASPSA